MSIVEKAKKANLVHVNWSCYDGVIFTYEGSESEILALGLIGPDDLPGEKKGCHRRTDEFHVSRLLHGNIRLRMNADGLFKRTPRFKQFMGTLLSDSRLSLVRREVM
jgi:hypothetical protein